MIKLKVQSAINEQIKKEEYSSRLYLAMAIWCEATGYPGASKFLYEHADEERMHMLKLVKYINERGGHAKISQLKAPSSSFGSFKEMFEKSEKQFISI